MCRNLVLLLFLKQYCCIISEVPKQNILLITGDFNAQVAEDATATDVLGKYRHGDRNDRGHALTDLCAELKLVIANTLNCTTDCTTDIPMSWTRRYTYES